MITRQSIYDALFTLKNTGVNVDYYLSLLTNNSDIPKEIIIFLRENSPQFQFFRYIQQHQKALMKSILDYETLSNYGKIKVLSSFITRVMIAVEYNNISEELVDLLELNELSDAINEALGNQDYSKVNEVLGKLNKSMKLFVKNKNIDLSE